MSESKILVPAARAPAVAPRTGGSRNWVQTALAIAGVALLYTPYLIHLFRFAANSLLYSHIPLIPLVVVWLLWTRRESLPIATARSARIAVGFAAAAGLLLLANEIEGAVIEPDTHLTLTSASWVLAVVAVLAWMRGGSFLRAAAFPLAFLGFMVPLPASWIAHVETVLQHGSAFVARVFFDVAGTSVFYNDLIFQLPGITLRVAPECSGIHSTLALLMVSLLAGHVFLRSTAKAALLAAFVLPLALLRNGFRIFVVGERCVTGGPGMIESPIHRQGGPIFFALSLIPFLVVLWLFVRSERRAPAVARTAAPSAR